MSRRSPKAKAFNRQSSMAEQRLEREKPTDPAEAARTAQEPQKRLNATVRSLPRAAELPPFCEDFIVTVPRSVRRVLAKTR